MCFLSTLNRAQYYCTIQTVQYNTDYTVNTTRTPPLKVGARPRSESMETERLFFVGYQGSRHEIDLIGFGWESIEF